MSPDHEPLYWWLNALAYAALAAIGGLLGYLMREMEHGRPIKWSKAILQAVAAAFTGFLILLLCNATGLSEEWKGVIVGLFGWLGANATIRVLETVVFKRLGLNSEPTQVTTDDPSAQ